eukprot:1161955-Pelagomonas_calceolata.AAC.11
MSKYRCLRVHPTNCCHLVASCAMAKHDVMSPADTPHGGPPNIRLGCAAAGCSHLDMRIRAVLCRLLTNCTGKA